MRWVALVAVLTIAVPVGVTAFSTPVDDPEHAVYQDDEGNTILTAVDEGIEVRTEKVGAGQRLTWDDNESWRGDVFYRVYRMDAPGTDTLCTTAYNVSVFCYLRALPIATTGDREFLDPSPPPGATYRVGVGTNWLNDPAAGDVFAFSPQVQSAPS